MKRIKHIHLKRVTITETLHKTNSYGLIHRGLIGGKKCIVKMLCLRTGAHYNKKNKAHYGSNGVKIPYETALIKYFLSDEKPPYLHSKFINRESVTVEDFCKEVSTQLEMVKLGLAPIIYDYGVTHTRRGIQYGIIVMEQMDITYKDYINTHPNLDESKNIDLITDTIKELHSHGWYHGDLQFSNVGLKMSKSSGRITDCKLIDWFFCNKITKKSQTDDDLRRFTPKSHELAEI